MHTCETCKNTFKTKSGLNTHKKTAKYCLKIRDTINLEFCCKFCSKIFTSKNNLEYHEKICKISLVEETSRKYEENISTVISEKIILEEKITELNKTLEEERVKNTIIEENIAKLQGNSIPIPFPKNNIKNTNSKLISEKLVRDIFSSLLGVEFCKTRGLFSRKALELDGYCDSCGPNMDIKIGFEYQGKQHYEYVPYFHGDDPVIGNKLLKKQQERDQIKRDECKKLGIHLVEVPFYIENKLRFIENKLDTIFKSYNIGDWKRSEIIVCKPEKDPFPCEYCAKIYITNNQRIKHQKKCVVLALIRNLEREKAKIKTIMDDIRKTKDSDELAKLTQELTERNDSITLYKNLLDHTRVKID